MGSRLPQDLTDSSSNYFPHWKKSEIQKPKQQFEFHPRLLRKRGCFDHRQGHLFASLEQDVPLLAGVLQQPVQAHALVRKARQPGQGVKPETAGTNIFHFTH